MDVDLSTYPKPALPVSALETAGQIGGLLQRQRSLQQADIGIDQSKLDLYNKHFQIMNNELSTLANDPNTTKEEVLTRMHRIGDTFNMPQSVRDQMEAEFANVPGGVPLGKDGTQNPILARTLDFTIKRGMDTQQKVNAQYGAPGTAQDNANIYTTRQGLRGSPQPQAVMPIQVAPTTGTVDTRQTLGNDQNGNPIRNPNFMQPTLVGPSGPSGLRPLPIQSTAGAVNVQPAPSANPLPVQAPAAVVTPPKNPAFATPLAPVKNQAQAPQGNPASPIVTGPPPTYGEGLKKYSEDQDVSAARSLALKPALNALALIKEVRTGPTTDTFNKIMATLKANNIIPTAPINDTTAAYQELNKYLYQYLGQTPFRSDAEQAMRASGSPNAAVQINQALTNLTKNAIQLDRVAIARPNAFKDTNYSNYLTHRSRFGDNTDQRAFGLDLNENEKDSQNFVDSMETKLNSKKASEQKEANKFFKSLRTAKDLGYY